MATQGVITFLPLAKRGSNGNSGNAKYVGENSEAVVYLDITAVSGTNPALNVSVEDTIDGINWDIVQSFTQASAISREIKRISNFSRYMRVSYTLTGTNPEFTFSVRAFIR